MPILANLKSHSEDPLPYCSIDECREGDGRRTAEKIFFLKINKMSDVGQEATDKPVKTPQNPPKNGTVGKIQNQNVRGRIADFSDFNVIFKMSK